MTMKRRESGIAPVAVLLVLALFALCVLGVALTGAEGYRRLTDRGSRSAEYRTAVQYISTRVRQSDQSGGIRAEDFHGQSTLVFREILLGTDYVTRVYCHDGYLRELFGAETADLHPEDGEALLPMEDMTVSREGELLSVTLVFPNGEAQELVFCLRSGEEIS